jgi:hypothetical protein
MHHVRVMSDGYHHKDATIASPSGPICDRRRLRTAEILLGRPRRSGERGSISAYPTARWLSAWRRSLFRSFLRIEGIDAWPLQLAIGLAHGGKILVMVGL